jgi:small multidrug resistance pump
MTTSYLFLALAVVLGVASNSFAKSAEGFTLFFPTIITAITIISCMYALSMVMKTIPMGVTYASFAGLAIIATVLVGVIKYNQVPNFYSIMGLCFIIIGVLMVNLLGNNKYRESCKLSFWKAFWCIKFSYFFQR